MLHFAIILVQFFQVNLGGTIRDQETGAAVQDAVVVVEETNQSVFSDGVGNFTLSIEKPGEYTIAVNHINYESQRKKIRLDSGEVRIDFILKSKIKTTEEVVVSGFRAKEETPVTQFNMNQKQIREKHVVYDIPMFLNNAPAIHSFSDNGSGLGYSYFRMRGIENTRINATINGIPFNDPETQGYFFSNFSDFGSSLQSIQIQRGVGTSTNGAASFGGSISFQTTDLSDTATAEVAGGYGSFNTRRISAAIHSGRFANNKLAVYGRFSSLATDGFRRNSGSTLNSYMFSAAYFGKKSLIKFTSFGGNAANQLSYIASPKDSLDADRRHNPLSAADKDNFSQTFHQLSYSLELSSKTRVTASAYYVKGDGYFDLNYPGIYYYNLNMPDFDASTSTTNAVVSYNLNTRFYGAMAYLNSSVGNLDLQFGLHGNYFESDHYQFARWIEKVPTGIQPNHEAYFNTGYKSEINAYAKLQYNFSKKFSAFADLQFRTASFEYKPKDKDIYRDTFHVDKMRWNFFNPKVGVRWNASDVVSFYLSGGITEREPTRVDYMLDDRTIGNIYQTDVKPEKVYNIEIGNSIRTKKLNLKTNIYFMEFENEIAATGNLNFVGYAIRKNTSTSFRRGIELDWRWNVTPYLSLTNFSNFSWNKISQWVQSYSLYDSAGNNLYTNAAQVDTFYNVDPILTPNVMINQGITVKPVKWLSVDLIGKYTGKMYLDNTNNEALTIPGFFFADARLNIDMSSFAKRGEYILSILVNNFTDSRYNFSGTPSHYFQQNGSSEVRVATPNYFPAAGINYYVSLTMKF